MAVASCSARRLNMCVWMCVRRSTARLTSGQRMALNDVEEAHVEDREGNRFFVYEHLSQVGGGAPTHGCCCCSFCVGAAAFLCWGSFCRGPPPLRGP